MLRKERKVVLGGLEYPLGKFKLGQVSEISVLLKSAGSGMMSASEAAAQRTAIYRGLQTGGYAGSFSDFEALEDVTVDEIHIAYIEVGRAIGYFSDPEDKTEPGEAAGAASP